MSLSPADSQKSSMHFGQSYICSTKNVSPVDLIKR